MLTNYRNPEQARSTKSTEVSFAQKGKGGNKKTNKKGNEPKGTDSKANSKADNKHSNLECYRCHEKGHIAPNCPKKNESANSNVQGSRKNDSSADRAAANNES